MVFKYFHSCLLFYLEQVNYCLTPYKRCCIIAALPNCDRIFCITCRALVDRGVHATNIIHVPPFRHGGLFSFIFLPYSFPLALDLWKLPIFPHIIVVFASSVPSLALVLNLRSTNNNGYAFRNLITLYFKPSLFLEKETQLQLWLEVWVGCGISPAPQYAKYAKKIDWKYTLRIYNTGSPWFMPVMEPTHYNCKSWQS